MRVRLKTIYAGPAGIFEAGALVTLTDAEAAGLISGGYASPEIETSAKIEAAVMPPAQETTQLERAPDLNARKTGRAKPAKRQ